MKAQGLITLLATNEDSDALNDTEAAEVADAAITILRMGLKVQVTCSTTNLLVVLMNRVHRGDIAASELQVIV